MQKANSIDNQLVNTFEAQIGRKKMTNTNKQ